MFVSVKLLGLQRTLTQKDRIQVPFSKGTRVADVFAYIRESFPELPFSEKALLVTVNDKVSTMDRILKSDDDISFLPFIGGG
ncbi:MAG: MoaD/ThiS family protein [Deltaproteobacteria bacterium]|nr:MoaD/ThiS family protein [Deltaproteobacteria bacterium]